ncbi:hypothetical protein QR685DRAFT_601307 [Neurospora intermedia]|uniref:Uncharacterized protein n=1 Tax=Neurospora intermedia TaxID=5142 RepID=A0ABR3CY24_NEUIN
MCLVQGRHDLGPGLMLGYVRIPTTLEVTVKVQVLYSVSVIADAEIGVEARAPLTSRYPAMVTIQHPASQGPEIEPATPKRPSVTFGLENVRYLAARLSFVAHSQLSSNTCLLVYNDQPSFLGSIISHIVFPSSTGLSNGVAQEMPSRILSRLVSPS